MTAEHTVPIQLYGLLYLEPGERHPNLRTLVANSVDVYLRCAGVCAETARQHGHAFRLLTNKPDMVNDRLVRLHIHSLTIMPFRFELDVPKSVDHYSAHYKIDVIKSFGKGELGEFVGLVDVDAVFLRALTLPDSGLIAYDVSHQVYSSTNRGRIVSDMERIAGVKLKSPRWYGGEFIAGTPQYFSTLSSIIDECWPRYIANIDVWHRTGAEMIVSPALNLAQERGLPVDDTGTSLAVMRFWSGRTLTPIETFAQASEAAMLHLPGDKKFLARQLHTDLSTEAFLDRFRRHLGRKIPIEIARGYLDRWRGHPLQYMPRL